jgi:hypothetical protein
LIKVRFIAWLIIIERKKPEVPSSAPPIMRMVLPIAKPVAVVVTSFGMPIYIGTSFVRS